MQTVLHGVIVFTKGEIQFSILLLTDLLRLPVPVWLRLRLSHPANVKTKSVTIVI